MLKEYVALCTSYVPYPICLRPGRFGMNEKNYLSCSIFGYVDVQMIKYSAPTSRQVNNQHIN